MKTRLFILTVTVSALLLSACSTSYHLGAGYDDLYYVPGDEPVAVVREDPAAFKDSYTAIDNVGQKSEVVDAGIYYPGDTLQGEGEYYEAGDEDVIVNNYYENEEGQYYEDGDYARRINRFHRPYGMSYYSSF